jgi:hypothetical protein
MLDQFRQSETDENTLARLHRIAGGDPDADGRSFESRMPERFTPRCYFANCCKQIS